MSWGKSCGKEGYPGIYSNVHKYKEWIESVTMCGDIECFNGGYCEIKNLIQRDIVFVQDRGLEKNVKKLIRIYAGMNMKKRSLLALHL